MFLLKSAETIVLEATKRLLRTLKGCFLFKIHYPLL